MTMFGDEIADEQQFKYTDDMLAELNNLTFSDLVTLSEETVQKLLPKEDVKLSGRIEKYGLDIDFTKLDYVEIEVHSDEYIGGIDENGHERMDNYNEVVNSISFYAAHDNSRLLIYDEANNLYEDTVELSEALERISEYLDLSRNSADIFVFIKPKDGERQYINPLSNDKQPEQQTKIEETKPQEEIAPDNHSGGSPFKLDMENSTEGVQLNLFGEPMEGYGAATKSTPFTSSNTSLEGKSKKKYGENCRYELDQYHECRKKLKELFPDGIIPKIKDLQDELKKAREDYAKMSAERKALKKEADRLSRLAQQKRDSQRTLSRYMENEQAAKRKKSQLE